MIRKWQYSAADAGQADAMNADLSDPSLSLDSTTFFVTTTSAEIAADPSIDVTNVALALAFTGYGFDATRVFGPSVAKVPGGYVMLYGGLPFANNIEIGLATSADGVNWARVTPWPVVTNAGSPSFASFREVPVTLLYENSTYKLWFNGDNTNLQYDPGRFDGFGYATSLDAINWSFNPNPIQIGPTLVNGLNLAEVVKLHDHYLAYYGDSSVANVTYVATSLDGINFNPGTAINVPTGYILEAATS